ncbi:HNH endonuclease signature motif containing protein [Niallia sp. Krafla_26]|uniref:HNH endonuclease signature motif containing protein n=1 Tax=Niallia sp. Krafla_26 TaxID=3064703 RepID=UPI003D170108
MAYHFYTPQQIEFLRENVKGRYRKELTEMFNVHFNLNQSTDQIKSVLKRYGLCSGIDASFKKGRVPWNAGMKGLQTGGKETQFKKGHIPSNYRPVGSERITRDGYTEVKVADPNKWRLKHQIIWEQMNGPIPEGHTVIFGDRNRQNFDADNLILVSRKQLVTLNKMDLIKDHAELTKIGITICNIHQKKNERRRKLKNG